MGDGRSEEREHCVALQPGQSAFVPAHRRNQMFEGAVDDLCPVLRVEMLGRGRRSLDVGKEHRHRSPFALHGPTGACRLQLGEEFVWQVAGEFACRAAPSRKGGATVRAERPAPVGGNLAHAAGDRQTRSTLCAELGVVSVVVAAGRTLHAGTSGVQEHYPPQRGAAGHRRRVFQGRFKARSRPLTRRRQFAPLQGSDLVEQASRSHRPCIRAGIRQEPGHVVVFPEADRGSC